MNFTVTTDNFTYEPASPGLGCAPNYLVTPRNAEGMSIELHLTDPRNRTCERTGIALRAGTLAWHVTEYDRNDEAMDDYWFATFAHADEKAAELLKASYDHDSVYAGANGEA